MHKIQDDNGKQNWKIIGTGEVVDGSQARGFANNEARINNESNARSYTKSERNECENVSQA